MMDYNDAMDYINQIKRCGIVPGLDSITRLCGRLGNPQDGLRFVHIAGTNGKGSVLAFISTCLTYEGYKIGRYISPTLFEYRERIQINGEYISEKDLCEGMEIVKKACDEIIKGGFNQPTPFEVETALAFWYFEKKNCDIVVLETGMGGTEDATNLIRNTLVAVITSVGMDHMKFLGDTLEDIARQKAGIIKKGCSVVVMRQSDKVLEIVHNVSRDKGCKFIVSDVSGASNIKYGLDGQCFDYGKIKKLQISLCGQFQLDNAVLALNVIDELKEYGFIVSEKAIHEGFCNTKWQGRFQVLKHSPYFIVDGAHNEDAAKKLIKTLDLYFTNRRFIYIMGMLRDKECEDVVSLTVGYADMVITVTPPDSSRAMGADELAKIVAKKSVRVKAVDSIEEAVMLALKAAGENDVVLAFGSLTFLGEIIGIIKA